jgi:hypothetical protein
MGEGVTLLYRKEGDEYIAVYEEHDRICRHEGCGGTHYPYPKITPLVEPPCECLEAQTNPHDYVLGHRQP